MAMPTWVDSLNGYTGNPPFRPDPGIELDASDIHLSGSTGATVRDKAQSLAQGMRIMTLEGLETEGDYRVKVAPYPLSLVNGGGS